MFKHESIAGKDVYIVEHHHHVLLPWSLIRNQQQSAPNLITLDHHTDTCPAFRNYSFHAAGMGGDSDSIREALLQSLDRRSQQSVVDAISKLVYDEHITAATYAGLINLAFVVYLDGGQPTLSIEENAYQKQNPYSILRREHTGKPPKRPFTYDVSGDRVFQIEHNCFIGCSKQSHDDDCYVAQCDQVLEDNYLSDQLQRIGEIAKSIGIDHVLNAPFILDIDLDFFHTAKAISPCKSSAFHQLIRNSIAITIATEEECTQALKIEDEQISTEILLQRIYAHIRSAQSP